MPTRTEIEREQFWKTLIDEIPAFLAFLDNWQIPIELRCNRFGIGHFHHPELLQSLEMLSPEAKLAELIDSVIFSDASILMWCGTAERLTRQLRESVKQKSCFHGAMPLALIWQDWRSDTRCASCRIEAHTAVNGRFTPISQSPKLQQDLNKASWRHLNDAVTPFSFVHR